MKAVRSDFFFLLSVLVVVLSTTLGRLSGEALSNLDEGAVEFNRDIRPILSDKCFACHGPDEKKRLTKLRFDTEPGSVRRSGRRPLRDRTRESRGEWACQPDHHRHRSAADASGVLRKAAHSRGDRPHSTLGLPGCQMAEALGLHSAQKA